MFLGRHYVRVEPLAIEAICLCGFRCYPHVICRVRHLCFCHVLVFSSLHVCFKLSNCPRTVLAPEGPKRGRLEKREWSDCIAGKNFDLIACTSARYQRFSRQWPWAANKETRTRGVVGSACLPSYSLIKSLRNARDSDLKQIDDAFKDPKDRFWEKNSSEAIVGNSEVQSDPAILNSVNSKSLLFRSNRSFPTP